MEPSESYHSLADGSAALVPDLLADLRHRLEGWLSESKVSLASAGPICNNANSLLSDVRLRLERASVLWAQTQYLNTAIDGQVGTLKQIYEASKNRTRKNRKVFERSLRKLDKQDIKLKNALRALEECVLDRAIEEDNELAKRQQILMERNQSEGIQTDTSGSQDSLKIEIQRMDIKPRNLRSFVDEDAVAQLRASTTETIDVIQQAHADVEDILSKLSHAVSLFSKKEWITDLGPADKRTSNDTLRRTPDAGSEPSSLHSSSEKGSDRDNSEWKFVFERGLETAHNQTTQIATHAHAMAMLLESLTRHYDQCCQAVDLLTLIEGTHSRNEASDGTNIRTERGDYDKEQLEDLEELAGVLSNDTTELSSVLTELQERYREIAELAGLVCDFQVNVCEKVYELAKHKFEQVEDFGKDVEAMIGELEVCEDKIRPEYEGGAGTPESPRRNRRKSHNTDTGDDNEEEYGSSTIGIKACIREMESLVEYYTLFHVSYQRLVLEIDRRRRFRQQMQSVIDEVAARVGKLIAEELQERKEVFESVADFLPGDLWPGLVHNPPFVEISKGGNWNLPDIGNDSVEIARQVLASVEQRMAGGSVESNRTIQARGS